MGKKKKTYVKPEMKIIEVKTEGVIAASGGESIIDPDDKYYNAFLLPQSTSNYTGSRSDCFGGGNAVGDLIEGQCGCYNVNVGEFWRELHLEKKDHVEICCIGIDTNNKKIYRVKKIQ